MQTLLLTRTVEFTWPETCCTCGGEMYVSQRSPHPVIIAGEKQTLTCSECDAKTSRSVSQDGTLVL